MGQGTGDVHSSRPSAWVLALAPHLFSAPWEAEVTSPRDLGPCHSCTDPDRIQGSWLPPRPIPAAGCCRHLGNESANGRLLMLAHSLSICLPNKGINSWTFKTDPYLSKINSNGSKIQMQILKLYISEDNTGKTWIYQSKKLLQLAKWEKYL